MYSLSFPEKILSHSNVLDTGSVVADFGCGVGYFSLPLREMVGKEGIVYSIDVNDDFLIHLRNTARDNDCEDNIKCYICDLEKENSTNIPYGSVDYIIISDVLPQIENKINILKEARRVIKNGLKTRGEIMIVEKKIPFTEDNMIIEKDMIHNLLKSSHFGNIKDIDIDSNYICIIAEPKL